MEYNVDTFRSSYPLWRHFIYHYLAYKELSEMIKGVRGDKEFWVYSCDAHLEMAAIYWCMIFGTDSNKSHWKQLELDESEFLRYLLQERNISLEKWKTYWKDMLYFRNNYVAHRSGFFNEPVPDFSLAYKSVLCLEKWVRAQIWPDIIEDKQLEYIGKINRRNIRCSLKSLSCIYANAKVVSGDKTRMHRKG